jgi:hypothetical protein
MSWVNSIEAELKKIFGSVKWEETAETTLTILSPLLTTVLALTAGEPVAAAVGGILAKIQTSLAAAIKVLADVKAGNATSTTAVATLSSTLTSVQADLQTLLVAAQVKNPATQQKVSATVNAVAAMVQGVLAVLPTGPDAVATPATTPAPSSPASA